MGVLWERGPSTVRDVWEVLNTARPLAYTTGMTILSRLAEKGIVERESTGRSYRYHAAKTPDELLAGISLRRVEEVVSDFGEVAIAQFVDRMKRLDPDRLKELLRATEDMPEGGA